MEPFEGIRIPVHEHDLFRARVPGEGTQVVAGGMAAEIKPGDFRPQGNWRPPAVEHDLVAGFGGENATRHRIGVGITDKTNRVAGIVEEVAGEHVRGRVLGHHSAGERVKVAGIRDQWSPSFAAGQMHAGVAEKLEPPALAAGGPGEPVDDRRQFRAESTEVHRGIPGKQSLLPALVQQEEEFLGLAQGEYRKQHRAPAIEGPAHHGGETFDLGGARVMHRPGRRAARRLHDQDIDRLAGEVRRHAERLILELDISSVEYTFSILAQHHPGAAGDVAGVEKFQGRAPREFQLPARAQVAPFSNRFLDIGMGEKRVFLQSEFLALGRHHVHRIVEHGLGEQRGEFGHVDIRAGALALRQRQAADVVVVGMGDDNGIEVETGERGQIGKGVPALAFRVHAGIQEDPRRAGVEQVAIGPDFIEPGEIGQEHGMEDGRTPAGGKREYVAVCRNFQQHSQRGRKPRVASRQAMKARTRPDWSITEAAHLLNRAAFGGPPEQIRALHAMGPEAAVDKILSGEKTARDPMPPPEWASEEAYAREVEEFMTMRREAGVAARPGRPNPANAGPEEQRAREMKRQKLQKFLRERSREQGVEMGRWWFRRMAAGPHPAAEKMALFWHGHFATSMEKVRVAWFMFKQNQLFRDHALGDFGALTKAITRDPAMMIYLDLQQSRKERPNENFAREVMELFTLGEGNYSESDIREAARAFTGYRLERDSGKVHFVGRQHDNGEKKFHGRTGNFGADEIVDILLEQPACATFIARKIWRYMVNDAPRDEQVEAFAAVLREEKFHIGRSLRRLFLSEDFYRRENIRAVIKSPAVFLAQMCRHFSMSALPEMLVLGGMREMGQTLFLPPNVAGWPGGAAWINTNTLFARYNIAGAIARGGDPDYTITGLGNGKQLDGKTKAGAGNRAERARRFMPKPDYAAIAPPELRANPEKLVDSLTFRFFQHPLRQEDREKFLSFARGESEGGLTDIEVGHLVHVMLSTPYYQLT